MSQRCAMFHPATSLRSARLHSVNSVFRNIQTPRNRPIATVPISTHIGLTGVRPPAALHSCVDISQAKGRRVPAINTVAGIGLLHYASRTPEYGSWVNRRDVRCFHATPRREGWPVIGYTLLSVFKSSGALEIARLVGRVTLSLSTIILFKNFKARKKLQHSTKMQQPEYEVKRTQLLTGLRRRTVLFHVLLFAPVFMFWIAIMASLERTPLTGRWRTILLSPEEEEEIASQLANGGWYNAVAEIVSQDGPATIIPPTDWRYQWVESVLRRLEQTIPLIHREQGSDDWVHLTSSGVPFPPPAEYPLRARPRASEYLRSICEAMVNKHTPPSSHGIPGAPYSLMLVDDPNASNAFSYGFGPDGAGGIVVFTGFLNGLLAECQAKSSLTPEREPEPAPRTWFSAIFGSANPSLATKPHPMPTQEQTSELATLMAHELAHLVLAHHLETLSSGTIVIPGFVSLVTDFVRVLAFPITMVFGPFVNDALANLGKASTLDLARIGEHCTSVNQEIEADVVSMRLLAYAGFDARDAVRFWEHRVETNPNTECKASRSVEPLPTPSPGTAAALTRKIAGEDHPIAETRILRLREELQRWDELRSFKAEQQTNADVGR